MASLVSQVGHLYCLSPLQHVVKKCANISTLHFYGGSVAGAKNNRFLLKYVIAPNDLHIQELKKKLVELDIRLLRY